MQEHSTVSSGQDFSCSSRSRRKRIEREGKRDNHPFLYRLLCGKEETTDDWVSVIMTAISNELLVSVVVVNYNGQRFLEDCFRSLTQQTYHNYEMILVDNGSIDNSISFMKEHYPEVHLVQLSSNTGFAGGTNAGIKEAKGEFILTLNNDTIADLNLLEEIVRPMQLDGHVGMCGAKMLLPDGRINSTAICISRSGAAWDRGMGEPDHGQYDEAGEIFCSSAGAALYRRSMLDEIGLFDEDFFLFMEDVDLAFRAQLAGWRCMYVPTARVVHMHGGTASKGSDTAVYYGNRNILWYVFKNFPARTILISSPWIIGRFFFIIPYYFLHGKYRVILKAKIDALKGLRIMTGKRKTIKKIVSDREINRWVHIWSHTPK
jgi:GT2 family glycosyltransferase